MANRGLAVVGLMVLGTAVTVLATARPTISARADIAPISTKHADDLLRQSTAQILALGCNLSNREGSAVVLGPGRLLTNSHVVVGSRLVDVSAEGFPTVVAALPSVARAGDVASVDAAIDLPGLALAGADPQVGERVLVAGFPSAPRGQKPIGLDVESAQVVGTLPGGDVGQPWPVLRLSVPVQPGMSGGPVLDASGHLAGLVFGNEVPTGQALAIPASALRQTLAAGGLVAAGCSS